MLCIQERGSRRNAGGDKEAKEAQSQRSSQTLLTDGSMKRPYYTSIPANYMPRLTSHFLFSTNANFIEKMNMLYMEQYISILPSFQFVSTAQYNGPTVYGLAI